MLLCDSGMSNYQNIMELNELNSIKMTRFCFIICKIPLNTCPDSLWALKNRSAILWFILSKSRMGGQVVVEAVLPVLWTDNFLIKMMAYRVLPYIQYCIFYRKIDYYSDCLWLFSRISTNFCSKTSERGSLAYRIMVQLCSWWRLPYSSWQKWSIIIRHWKIISAYMTTYIYCEWSK